jgi:hypothetical protein
VRWIIVAAGVLAAVGLFLVVRPSSEPDRGGRTPPPSSATPTPQPTDGATTPAETPSPSRSPTPAATVIEVTVRGGGVDGPSDPEVQQGERVRIVVEADVSDEVHLHGYDLSAEVTPDRAAEIRFRATATGVFEVELEALGLVLFQLRVVP